MKKFIGVLLLLGLVSTTIFVAKADAVSTTSYTETQDCKTVGNVNIEIRYMGATLYVSANNGNDYAVTIAYKVMATNGYQTYPVDSGVLRMGAKGNAYGPNIDKMDGFSYYLEVNQPQYCD